MKTVAIVDYGMGNLRSVAKALEHVAPPHSRVLVTDQPQHIREAARVVVPGQGAMPDCMAELRARGLIDVVLRAAEEQPLLGICVGLQLLFGAAAEGDSHGLGLLPGTVPRFADSAMHTADGQRLKVPHMGWNEVLQTRPHPLWAGIEDGARFYFVHSYHVTPEDESLIAATTEYGLRFCSAVARDRLFAVQFHPEKSARDGLQLLANFIQWQP